MSTSPKRIDEIYADISGITHTLRLDELYRDVSSLFCKGEITYSEYEEIDKRIANKRNALKSHVAIDHTATRRFARKARQRSPNRALSRERRRMLGSWGAMPRDIRVRYTEGERAALCVISGVIKECGVCDFPIDKIAALAGVCRTTVQNALHEARRLGHLEIIERPRPGKKNLTNLITIKSREWKAWIVRGPKIESVTGSKTFLFTPVKTVSTTRISKKERAFGTRGPP